MFQGSVQSPGGQVTAVLTPVLGSRPSLNLTAPQTWQATDGVATVDRGPDTVVQLQVEVRQMEDAADRHRAGGKGWRLVGTDVIEIRNIQHPVGLS